MGNNDSDFLSSVGLSTKSSAEINSAYDTAMRRCLKQAGFDPSKYVAPRVFEGGAPPEELTDGYRSRSGYGIVDVILAQLDHGDSPVQHNSEGLTSPTAKDIERCANSVNGSFRELFAVVQLLGKKYSASHEALANTEEVRDLERRWSRGMSELGFEFVHFNDPILKYVKEVQEAQGRFARQTELVVVLMGIRSDEVATAEADGEVRRNLKPEFDSVFRSFHAEMSRSLKADVEKRAMLLRRLSTGH